MPGFRYANPSGYRSTLVRLPLWLKRVFSLWMMIWAPSYAVMLGVQNFFWLCNPRRSSFRQR